MKTNRQNLFRSSVLRFVTAATFAVGGLSSSVFAQTTYYWDGNGATAGSGAATLAGTWGTTAYWGTSATGVSATTAATITSLDTVVFAANDGTAPKATNELTNYNGGYTVTLGSTQSVAGLVINGNAVGSGDTGGTLTLTGTGSPGLNIGAGGVTMNGSNGDPVFNANIGTITLTADQTWNTYNARVWKINAPVVGNATVGFSRLWTLGYVNQYTSEYNASIADGSGGGKLALTLDNTNGVSTGGATTYISTTANSYTGKTTIKRGILQVRSMANAGSPSSLGAPFGSDSIIDIGSDVNSATLTYNGVSASTTDRVLNLAGTTGGITIRNDSTSAANTLSFTSAVTNAAGIKTLTLRGGNTGNNTFSGAIGDAADASKLTLAKNDAGVWVLGGANTYSGGTTISAGTLAVSAASSLGSNVAGNNITIAGGNLLLSAATNFGASQSIVVNSGGVGVGYTPVSLPTLTDNTGAVGGVYGINYSGDGGVSSLSTLYNGNWFLGSFGTGTYTGANLAAGNGSKYRLGGGGGTFTLQNNVLTGANDLVVGGTGGGNVILPGANTYTGKTTLQNGTLRVSSLNKVVGGSASSSLGAPSSAANGTIDIGSGSNAVTLAYTGTGETTDRVVNFTGTTGTVAFTNSGAGNLVFSNPSTFTGTGARTIQLGATTDTFGGSLTGLADNGANKTAVSKAGLSNSTWMLPGNTFTGTVKIDGGVLELSLASLANSYINLDGDGQTQYGVLQTNGTLTRNLGTAAGNIRVGINSGFAAKGGPLTVTLNANAQLTWQSTNFLGAGEERLVFGSTTANSQVEFTNPINLNTNDAFQRRIYVEQGVGGDSALLSGVLSPGLLGGGPALAPTGLEKLGGGTLVLGAANTYPGTTLVSAGKLLVNGSTSTGAVTVNSNATLGGIGTIGGAITVNSSGILAPGTIAPGASIAILAASSSVTFGANSSFAVELNAVDSDRLNIAGALNITANATLNINSLVPANADVYVLANYTSLTGPNFQVSGLPLGYELQYGANQLALVKTGPVTPYSTWAATYFLTGLDALATSDPDNDGISNLVEFALNGIPNSGSSLGVSLGKMATVSGTPNVLTYTIAVLEVNPETTTPADFNADVNRQTATTQGVTYTVEASNNLSDWGVPMVTEVTGEDAQTIWEDLGLPVPGNSGWSYKTFRTDGSASPDDSTDFIRVRVEQP